MIHYAIAWQPGSDNLGDDLRTLAASRLLPRVDLALDIDRLDEPLPGLSGDDRVVALLSGPLMQHSAHWPPAERVSPACVGVHLSEEDVWGLRAAALDGAGKAYLERCSPIGCRDDRTMRLMEALGIPHRLTACLTLTLERPEATERAPYICCVDVPDSVTRALMEFAPGAGVEVRESTHLQEHPEPDYKARMRRAEEVLQAYAGARFVVTRRLHCAMACLAIGTPVLMLYNVYEDLSRFSPMDGMMRMEPVEAFLEEIQQSGFPALWENPPEAGKWRASLREAVDEAIAEAAKRPLPILPEQEAARWRQARLYAMTDAAREKIHQLEQARYEALHEKFALLMREDTAKAAVTALLKEPETVRALRRIALRRKLAAAPWYQRPALWLRLRRGDEKPEDLLEATQDALKDLGWPERS